MKAAGEVAEAFGVGFSPHPQSPALLVCGVQYSTVDSCFDASLVTKRS